MNNNLFDQEATTGILKRLEQLQPTAQKQWGKMEVNQMLAHCTASLETAMGLNTPARLGFVGRLFGRLLKPRFFGDKPFMKNSATDKSYIITGNPDFEEEKQKVMQRIQAFYAGGPARCTTQPQAFFGPLTPQEWALMQWKHFDHHLRQFGA